MAVQQAQFFCPQCRCLKLFTRHEMNHTPHILASVFLCGLWLPVWAIMAATYNPLYRCAVCGFGDRNKYLQNPNLRQSEREQATLKGNSPNSKNNPWIIGAVACAGFLFLSGLIYLSVRNGKQPAVTNQNIATQPSAPENKSAEILRDAKSFIEADKGKMTDSGYYALYVELRKIPNTAPEYVEAQKILTQYKKQIDAADKRLK